MGPHGLQTNPAWPGYGDATSMQSYVHGKGGSSRHLVRCFTGSKILHGSTGISGSEEPWMPGIKFRTPPERKL